MAFDFNKLKKDSGFTLIEIVVVISIIVSLSSLGYVVYSRISENQNYNNTYNDLTNDLFEAKSNTLSQVDSDSTCENNSRNLVGYQLSVNSDANTYAMNIVCATDTTDPNTWVATVFKTVTLDSDIGISIDPVGESILFKVPNGMVDKEYNINLFSEGNSSTIVVSTSGAILQ